VLYDGLVRTQIAAVVNLHEEGSTATPSIISAWRACEAARENGLFVELLLVLDNPDDATTEVAASWTSRGARVVDVAEGDLGAARNAAVADINAEWIAFLDADDLWGEDWLIRAHGAASESLNASIEVWHPQVNVIFGDHHSLLHHIDSTDPRFCWSRFALHNAWTALSFVRSGTLRETPFPRNDLASGFGFEDWSWNMAILDRGGRHRVVTNTCHFIRRVDGASLLGRSQQALRTRYPQTTLSSLRTSTTATPTEVPDAGTHVDAAVDVGHDILRQITLASTIAPEVEDTLSSTGHPTFLPQNFNTHVTAGQLALEELWRSSDHPTTAATLDASRWLDRLDPDERAKVVAEFVLDELSSGRALGESALLAEVTAIYPQLGETVQRRSST
jgi:hypothetical protein